MRRTWAIVVALAGITAGTSSAEVLDAAPNGFSLANEVVIEAGRDRVWQAAIAEVGDWWSSAHTISGDARNMSINAVPQGCFCEALGDQGGVVHMTVTFVNSKVLLRLTGGLGPLGLMGIEGNMVWEFFDDGAGTRVTFSYAVGGYRDGGLDTVAGPVDSVIADALHRLKAYVETGSPESAN